MLYDDKYSYILCDDYAFNNNYLLANEEGRYSKYVLVFYKAGEKVLSKRAYSLFGLNEIENIILKYYIESIVLTGMPFESEYEYSEILLIKGLGCFKKVIPLDNDDIHLDKNLIKEKIQHYDKEWDSLNIDEQKFFND